MLSKISQLQNLMTNKILSPLFHSADPVHAFQLVECMWMCMHDSMVKLSKCEVLTENNTLLVPKLGYVSQFEANNYYLYQTSQNMRRHDA